MLGLDRLLLLLPPLCLLELLRLLVLALPDELVLRDRQCSDV